MKTFVVTKRVIRQLIRDKKFLVLSVVAPLVIIFFLKVTIDSVTPVNQAAVYSRLVVPFVSAIVFFLCFLLSAIALVRERTSMTLSRMFVSGLTRFDVISGYFIGYAGLATIQALLAMLEAYWMFDLTYSSQVLWSLFLVVWLLAVTSLGMGILVSNAARTEAQVIPFIPLVILPSFFFSGVFSNGAGALPVWAQNLSYLAPLRYAADSVFGLIRGETLFDVRASIFELLVYGAVLIFLAALTLKERD